jgi:4-amino-4-deoxy-L-arabinose transferase-like glycosyltransferase
MPRFRLSLRVDAVTNNPDSTQPPQHPLVRVVLDHPLVAGLLLLLPIVFLLPPLPIDETRYLAVAWEMRLHGEFLVPHLNGALYSQKPPLLFWLIDAGWLLTGVHAWTARAVTLACSVLSLLLMQRLTLRLTASETAARLSMWLLLGTIYFAAFANAIMFDVPLTTCVLIAVHGVCDLTEGRTGRGVLVTGIAIGLGILVKGPVMLLDIAFVALVAPWWSASTLHGRRGRYFGAVGLAILLGAAIGLAWAIPAALHGGPKYAHAIFLHQTLDRIEGVKGASAHGRPWWWYGMVFPLMLLPWPLVMRGAWSKLRALADDRAMRLAIAWLVPTFVAFSLVAGKQPHYLLPMIPAVALALALAIERGALRVRGGLFALLLIALGIAAAIAPHYAATHAALAMASHTSPLWGVIVVALGIALLVGARRDARPVWPALAMLVLVLVVKLAIEQGQGVRYDISGAAAEVRAAQDRGQPIVHLGWHHGVYEFAGRLLQPLPVIEDEKQFPAWAQDHPDGLVMSFDRRYRFRANPVYTQPFRGGEVSIWTVHDALVSGIDPASAHARAGAEDDDED